MLRKIFHLKNWLLSLIKSNKSLIIMSIILSICVLLGISLYNTILYKNSTKPKATNNHIISNIITKQKNTLSFNKKIGVPVLEYHMIAPLNKTKNLPINMVVTPEELDEQLNYFKNQGYVTITFDDLYNFMKHQMPIPDKSFIISFDDGYESNYIYLPNILKKYNMKAEIAIVTGMSRVLDGTNIAPDSFFTWKQAKEMQDSGFINIESHTVNHVNLNMSYDLLFELQNSKVDIFNHLRRKTDVIVYPEGYYDTDVITNAKKCGYLVGVTIDRGINYYNDDPMKIKRIMVSHWNTGKSIMAKINKYRNFLIF